ncbi:MAG: hypothetical protein ACP5N2_02070 [Candidatus Nanoarchaeia archaeon]
MKAISKKWGNTKMKKLFLLTIMALVLSTMALAQTAPLQPKECMTTSTCDVKFESICQDFYDDDKYYTLATWAYDVDTKAFVNVNQNKIYRYFDIQAEGTQNLINWKSDYKIRSIVVTAGDSKMEMPGQRIGTIESKDNVDYIAFCGKKSTKSEPSVGVCPGDGCDSTNDSNGVPVFPGLAAGAAILVVTLGLIFIRKN